MRGDGMKVIRYWVGSKHNPIPVEMGWNEANEQIAKGEALDGKYTVVDDGTEEPTDRIAQLEEALQLLLSGVTE